MYDFDDHLKLLSNISTAATVAERLQFSLTPKECRQTSPMNSELTVERLQFSMTPKECRRTSPLNSTLLHSDCNFSLTPKECHQKSALNSELTVETVAKFEARMSSVEDHFKILSNIATAATVAERLQFSLTPKECRQTSPVNSELTVERLQFSMTP